MAAGHFIKNNLALIAGIAVPILLVVGFLLTSTMGKMITPAPQHTAYFVLQDHENNDKARQSIDIKVTDDGKIIVTATPVKLDSNGYPSNVNTDILVSYDAATNTLREHRFSPPTNLKKGSFTPDAIKDVRLSIEAQAADGYSVIYGNRGSHSIASDIFISRGAEGYRIRKNGAVYRLPDRSVNGHSNPYYNSYYNMRFLGWDTEKTK